MCSKISLDQLNSSSCRFSATTANPSIRSRFTWAARLSCRCPSSMPRSGTHRACWERYPEGMPANVVIRRAAERAVTNTPWLESRHSFSFGDHYDPHNTHHGLLLVNNDDIVEP